MQHESGEERQGGWKSWLWMVLCCVPMVAIGVLLAFGYWSLR